MTTHSSASPIATPDLRVLIVTEHASARFGGEAALPLHYFRVLRRRGMAVWLVTHARTRDELLALYPNDDRIIFVEDTALHRAMWQAGKYLPHRISYITTGFISRLSTQIAQRRVVKRLVSAHAIDVVHQPMPVSPREPSLLHGFGVPVVIGPMNGGMEYPPGFSRGKGRLESLVVNFGRASALLMNWLMPGKRRAAALIVANRRTRDALPAGVCQRVIELVENGVELELWNDASVRDERSCASGVSSTTSLHPARPSNIATSTPTTFIFMGRLVGWKAVDILLDAFARAAKAIPMRLWILGDGDEMGRLVSMAAELSIAVWSEASPTPADDAGTVRFFGWQSQKACAALLRQSDCLVLPSLFECGGAVVLEAMAAGKPVIATAWGGPVDYLDESCGILVPPKSPSSFVDELAASLVRMASSESLRLSMGAHGRAKVAQEFDWELKVDEMLAIYRDLTDEHGDGR